MLSGLPPTATEASALTAWLIELDSSLHDVVALSLSLDVRALILHTPHLPASPHLPAPTRTYPHLPAPTPHLPRISPGA